MVFDKKKCPKKVFLRISSHKRLFFDILNRKEWFLEYGIVKFKKFQKVKNLQSG